MYPKIIDYYGENVAAIPILRNIRNLFVPKWRNSNPGKRQLALDKISKEELSVVAKHEPKDSVREEALRKLAYDRFELDTETIEILIAEKNQEIKLNIFTETLRWTYKPNQINNLVNILQQNISDKLNKQCYLRLQALTCCYKGEIEEPYQDTEIIGYEEIIDYAPAGPDNYPLKEITRHVPITTEVTKYRKVPALDPQATLEKRTSLEKQYQLEPGILSRTLI